MKARIDNSRWQHTIARRPETCQCFTLENINSWHRRRKGYRQIRWIHGRHMKAGGNGKGRLSEPLPAGVSLRLTLAIRPAIAGRCQEISKHINFHGRRAIAIIIGGTRFRPKIGTWIAIVSSRRLGTRTEVTLMSPGTSLE